MKLARNPLLVLIGSASATVAANLWWRRRPIPGGHLRWNRVNHSGRTVSLLEGPALVSGVCVPLAVIDPTGAAVGLASGVIGGWDDLNPDAARKGLRGHLGALGRGELSPGAVKVLGLTALGALVSSRASDQTGLAKLSDVAVGTAIVAGSANLINLFDLRPGRALKVSLMSSAALLPQGDVAVAAALGASLASLPADLASETMLGDTGANAVGALLGLGAIRSLPRGQRCVLAAGIVTLTLVSEKVSFSAVIAGTPGLREIDQWGRA